MSILLGLYVGAGIFLMLLSLPLLLKKIPPNPVYGFRLSPALDDPRIWYETNTHSAKRLMVAGASSVVAAIALYFVPSITLDIYALGCLSVFAIVAGVGFVQSVKYMKSMANSQTLDLHVADQNS
jgi:SdpI/YfhL protein family